MRALFRNRNYRIYLVGNTVDTIGDMAFWLAAAIWVKELTGSTAQLGACILMLNLGTLLSPAAGVLVDRLRRKRTLMATNAVTALLPLTVVGSITAIQLHTPNELLGRVSGADNLLVNGAQSIGIAVCAAVVGAIFYRDLCYFVGGMIMLSAAYLASRTTRPRDATSPAPRAMADADPGSVHGATAVP